VGEERKCWLGARSEGESSRENGGGMACMKRNKWTWELVDCEVGKCYVLYMPGENTDIDMGLEDGAARWKLLWEDVGYVDV
jgi:hypothetical protein